MNRFNLTFSGEIVEGQDQELVKLRFANKFAIDDPVRLERFFSGETVILRRNLERKDAAQIYHELQLLGLVAALVKVKNNDEAEGITPQPPSGKSTEDSTTASTGRAANRTAPRSKRVALTSKQAAAPVTSALKNNTETQAVSERGQPTVAAPWPEGSADIAAEIKARKQAAQQLAAEKVLQEKAALEAQQREIAETAAREHALAAEQLRLAEEERARQDAEQARMAAEESARKAAEQAEIKRLEAAEVARKKALKAAARRKAAEEEAQRKARRNQEKAEKARLKAEETTRRQAELAEKKRLAAVEEARRQAELEEKQRLAAEEEALREALRKAALEKKKRLAAEEEARRKAALEQKKRLAAEEEAHRNAALEEKKRLAAEEAAQLAAAVAAEDARLKRELAAIKRREAEETARLRAELEEKARQAAEQAAYNKAETQRQLEEAERQSAERRRIAAEELAARATQLNIAQNVSTQAGAIPSATAEPVRLRASKTAKARVKTALEVPLRKKGETPQIGVPGQRKRQSGEPNLYKLRPFRNSDAVRARAAQAKQRMRKAYALGVIALTALLIAGGSFLQNADQRVMTGARAIAINANSEPVLLAGDFLLLHDRAGVSKTKVSLDTLGVSALEPPLGFDNKDALFARGRLLERSTESIAKDKLQLLRCELTRSTCAPFSSQLQDVSVDAFVINPVDNSLLVADHTNRQLLKVDSEGASVASISVAIPADPVLRLHGGLLLMNSAEGPAISVFRYEDEAFGKQLDEILLLPPTAEALEQARIGDFVWSGDTWWVYLRDPDSGAGALHRFDEEWNYVDTVTTASTTSSTTSSTSSSTTSSTTSSTARSLQLVNWGQKTLLNDPQQSAIARYNAAGRAEAPFASTQLQELVSGQQQRDRLVQASWHAGLLICALATLLGCGFGYWHGLRNLVYRARREQGAEPLDEHAAALQWMEPVQTRQAQLRRTGIRYGLGALGALLLAVALNVSVSQMAALLIALSGPGIALLLLGRNAAGYIGVLGDRLLLVDHSGLYHLAGGSRLQYRGPFLAIDDIVVFSGSRLLPAFSPAPLQRHVWPLAQGGIKVDRKTIAIKLLECRHPLALGVIVMVATVTVAILLVFLPIAF